MDKNDVLLSLYSGRKIDAAAFSEYFAPNGATTIEFIHYGPDREDGVVFQLLAFIDNDHVKSVEAFKVEVTGGGHFRANFDERSLTASEWKYCYQIFDECFPDQSEEEMSLVIENALQKKVTYSGYSIKKELKYDFQRTVFGVQALNNSLFTL